MLALGPGGESQEPWIPHLPLRDPAASRGGALGGGHHHVHHVLPWPLRSPSTTANNDDENDYDEHDGNHNYNEDEDICVGILRILRIGDTPAASHQHPMRQCNTDAALSVWGQPVVLQLGTSDAIND